MFYALMPLICVLSSEKPIYQFNERLVLFICSKVSEYAMILFFSGYECCASFDEFLMDMKQSKRKSIRQERKKVGLFPLVLMIFVIISGIILS